MDEKRNLQNNFKLMYSRLCWAIDDYLKHGHNDKGIDELEAYLAATMHALMDYAERYLKDDDIILACKYVNNTIKHVHGFITHKEITGGFTFPISFPFGCEEIKVVWKYNESLDCRHKDQKEAYKRCFVGKPLLEILQPLADIIEMGVENKPVSDR